MTSRAPALGDAEVEDFRDAVSGDRDVAWLQVAMDHTACVRGSERVGDLQSEIERTLDTQRTAASTVERLSPSTCSMTMYG